MGCLQLLVRLFPRPLDIEQQRIESTECGIPWVQFHRTASGLKRTVKLTAEEECMSETVLDLGILRPVPQDILKQRNSRTGTPLTNLSLCQSVEQLKLMRLPRQGFAEQSFSFAALS